MTLSSPLKRHYSIERLDKLLIYTQSKSIPYKLDTLRELRSILRICQILFSAGMALCIMNTILNGLGAFSLMCYSSIVSRFSTSYVYNSGISFMSFTSITAFLISFTFLTVYLFPYSLNVPPHRHARFSIPEIVFDAILIALWLSASTNLIVNGSCKQSSSFISVCPEWIASSVLGYVSMILFAITFIMGIMDIRNKQDNFFHSKDQIMFARGNWRD